MDKDELEWCDSCPFTTTDPAESDEHMARNPRHEVFRGVDE